MRKLGQLFTIRLLVVLLLTGLTVWNACRHHYVLAVFCALALVASIVWLYKLYHRDAERVRFLLDAVESKDFNFHFASETEWGRDKVVTEALNKITRILADIRQETIEKERYYERILSNVNTGVIAFDDKGFVYQTNPEALKLLGLSVFTHVKQLDRISPNLSDLLLTSQQDEKRQVTLNNERGTVQLSMRISRIDVQNRKLKVVAINDIRNELDDKEIDSWVALTRVLTHEIMNAITPITSLSDSMLKMLPPEGDDLRNGLETICTTSRGLMNFVDSYRRFTHIPTPEPSLFYARPFAERCLQLARNLQNSDTVSFKLVVEPDDILVYADENLISQVMNNLLKNAVQAIGSEGEGRVEVFVHLNENEEVVMEVSNTGAPISAELEEHIFIPFFTTKENGSGIGLSISRQIMRMSGGTLTLRTHPQTTFVLTFER